MSETVPVLTRAERVVAGSAAVVLVTALLGTSYADTPPTETASVTLAAVVPSFAPSPSPHPVLLGPTIVAMVDRLVTAGCGIRQQVFAVGDQNALARILTSVTAGYNAYFFALVGKHFRDQGRKRCLAGPARGNVADTDRLGSKIVHAKKAAVVECVPHRYTEAVEPAKWREWIHQRSRKFFSIGLPASVKIDSG